MARRQIEVVVAARVSAPAGLVWALICDLRRVPEWVDAALAMTRLPQPLAARGVAYSERTRIIGPLVATTHWGITEFEAPRRQVHVGRARGFAPGVLVLEVEPAGEETTTYTQTVRLTSALGPLTSLVNRLLEPSIRASLERNLVGLEQALRGSSPTAPGAAAPLGDATG